MTCRGPPAAAMTSRTFSGETVFTHMLSDELYNTVVFLPVVCGRTITISVLRFVNALLHYVQSCIQLFVKFVL